MKTTCMMLQILAIGEHSFSMLVVVVDQAENMTYAQFMIALGVCVSTKSATSLYSYKKLIPGLPLNKKVGGDGSECTCIEKQN